MTIKKLIGLGLLLTLSVMLTAQQTSVRIGLLKYKGGGDWYANPTSLPNLIRFCNDQLKTNIYPEYMTVEPGSPEIYSCAMIHMTGHGNVVFSGFEAENLRNYMLAGGFLHIDDNYGMDEFVRREIKKIFPDKELVELPFNHPIYHAHFEFQSGLPKIHEHDANRRRVLELLTRAGSCCSTATKPIWATAGKMHRCTTIQKKHVLKHCRWAPTL